MAVRKPMVGVLDMSIANEKAVPCHRQISKSSSKTRSVEEVQSVLVDIRPLIHRHRAVRASRLLAPCIVIVDLRSGFKAELLAVERHIIFQVRPAQLDCDLPTIRAVGAKIGHRCHNCDG